jgi:hypothetical protein
MAIETAKYVGLIYKDVASYDPQASELVSLLLTRAENRPGYEKLLVVTEEGDIRFPLWTDYESHLCSPVAERSYVAGYSYWESFGLMDELTALVRAEKVTLEYCGGWSTNGSSWDENDQPYPEVDEEDGAG